MLKREHYLKTVKRPYPLLFNCLVMEGYADEKYFVGFLEEPFSLPDMAHVDDVWYYGAAAFEKGGRLAMAAWKHPSRFAFAEAEFAARERRLLDGAKGSFADFCTAYRAYMPALALVFVADGPAEAALRRALAARVPEGSVDEIMHALNVPLRDNVHKEEELALVMCSDVAAHVAAYPWLYARYGEERIYTAEEARARLASIHKDEFLRMRRVEKELLQHTIADTKRLLGDDAWLVDIFQYIIYYRTHRTDILNRAIFLAMPMLKTTARAVDLSYEQLLHCSAQEIVSGALPSPETLAARMHACSEILEQGVISLLTGEASRKVVAFFQDAASDATEVRGSIACKGHATGPVRLVIGKDDFEKIQEGDILVTSMTTPDMVPVMRRAAAFVTDEGGVTCHAAIISREMRKPCIIGTGVATQIFKDGDRVEVNANLGVARKIA